MKIVVLDGYTENPGDLSWDGLKCFGEVSVYERTSYVDDPIIAERLSDADIAVINKTPITRKTIDRCPKLKFITVLATGYNVVDCAYAAEKGIIVSNVPQYGTRVVAQYAVGLLLEICAHYGYHSDSVFAGKWTDSKDFCYWDYPLIELSGKTAGIIGLGRIGQGTAKILKALNMRVIASDTHETENGKNVAEYVPIDTLFAESDVIFLHCPLFNETREIINRENIRKMKKGVILINNSRGQLVDENALAEALNNGQIYAAALDVVSTEPIKADNPLLKAKNCIITPHISWAAKEARQRILDITLENIEAYVKGQPVNTVNQ